MYVYICVCMYVCMDLSVRFANMMNLAQTTLEMLSCFIQSKMQFSSLNFYSNLRFSLITFEVFVESKLGNNWQSEWLEFNLALQLLAENPLPSSGEGIDNFAMRGRHSDFSFMYKRGPSKDYINDFDREGSSGTFKFL